MLAHNPIVSRDLAAARRFYAAAARPLGLSLLDWKDGFILGHPSDEDPILSVRSAARFIDDQPETQPAHIAIEAKDDYTVRAFFRAALEAGGRQVGYPAPQPTREGAAYYAARVADPDGNCIECGWRH